MMELFDEMKASYIYKGRLFSLLLNDYVKGLVKSYTLNINCFREIPFNYFFFLLRLRRTVFYVKRKTLLRNERDKGNTS